MPRNSVVSGHALMKDACTVPGSRLKKGEAICFSEETPVMRVFVHGEPTSSFHLGRGGGQ